MSDYIDYLTDVFALMGPISSRKMFGGYGIYHSGLMFGLVADDTLYLKSDKQIAAIYEAEGLERFTYVKNGKPMHMSYYQAPEEIYDDQEIALVWGKRAYEAAVRAKK